jgi:DNA excision repair protein ERCC-6
MSKRKQVLTLAEMEDLLDDIESDVEEVEVAILPPSEDGNVTEEEDINDETLNQVIPNDVCGEIVVSHPINEELIEENSEPKTRRELPKWRKNKNFDQTLPQTKPQKLYVTHPELIPLSPFEIFLKFIPIEYMQELAQQTKLYAMQKGFEYEISGREIGQFFGLLLFSGYHSVPNENLYWSTSQDMNIPIVSQTMPRNSFKKIKQYFHLVDNSKIKSGDKLAKIAPFYEHLISKFTQFGIFHDVLSIDESMVPYYGHHSCKMFIKGKPIRFGYKIWMLCSSNGYPYNLQVYSGKDPENSGPLGHRVIDKMIQVLDNPSNHEIYFDNFFTSYDLLMDLRAKGVKATGTVRDNRTRSCPLIDIKNFKKENRGFHDYRSNGSVEFVRWNDNSVVTIGSNHLSHSPLGKAKRYSRKDKKRVDISQPHLIKRYNEGMGGVDLLDRLLGTYRPQLRSKKWWWNLFSNGLNMALVASWRLHCEIHEKSQQLSHLEFLRSVTQVLLQLNDKISPKPGPKAKLSMEVRISDDHYLISTTQGRCAECMKNTKKKCFGCDKRLHQNCFILYHQIQANNN